MASAKKEYSKIADKYTEATQRDFRQFVYVPTLDKLLKNIKGKNVLDVGCGEGISSRFLIKKGAKAVVGMDVSKELINIAKTQKHNKIEFIVKDCIKSKYPLKQFDVVTAIMFIHYCKTKKEIENLFKKLHQSLKNGGIFYSLTVNPKALLGYNNYGVRITPKNRKEGSAVKIELFDFDWNKFCEFTNYYWSEDTYSRCLKKAGFKDIRWYSSTVSSTGIKKFGRNFWEDFYKMPVYKMVVAKK